jgi:hypothetical protein
MVCRDRLPAGRKKSAVLLAKFNQFHDFNFEHGFGATVFAEKAKLSF